VVWKKETRLTLTLRPKLILWVGLFAAFPTQAAIIYQVDDGTIENSVGLSGGGELAWANRFTVLPGGESITGISVYWDSVYFPVGSAVSVTLWSDPNSDGSPVDAVLITSLSGFSGSGWVYYGFPAPVYIGSAGTSFFAGAAAVHGSGSYPAALDQSSPQGQSWVWFPPDQPSGAFNIDDYFPGNWMIRGEAGLASEIPEPSSFAFLAGGLFGIYLLKRRG
jgi:hypothetical protein